MTVYVEYTPPLGGLGDAVAKLFNDPQKQLEDDLGKLGGLIQDAPRAVTPVAQDARASSGVSSTIGAAGTTAAGTATDYGMAGNVDSTVQKAENMTGGMADTGEMLTSDGRTLESALADAAERTPGGMTPGATTSSTPDLTRAVIPGMPVSTPEQVDSKTQGPYSTDGAKTNTNPVSREDEVRKQNL